MADTKISALTAASAAALANEFAINEAGTTKKVTGTQLQALIGPTLITGNSGTANAAAAPSETWQILSSNATVNGTTSIVTVMTTSSLAAGTYWYRYDIIGQAAASTTSMKFSVDFTGTVTKTVYHLFFPSQGVTAATGVVSQVANTTTGNVWAHQSTRTDATVLGPETDHDGTGDVHYVMEGILVCSTSGNLLLGHASEAAANTTVQSGTLLVLRRFA